MSSKITALTALTSAQPDDVLAIVDVHDTTMAASGTTKKMTVGAFLGAVGASGDVTGATDTANLQAALTAARTAGGGLVTGSAGGHYYLSAALDIGSGTTLDMTGCTITEPNGLQNRMIGNYSYAHPVATAADAAISSGSNVVTTSLGASAVAGQAVVIQGAGGNGNGVLCGIVSSATPTTITLKLLRNARAANATHTVSSAAVTLYNRDSDITVRGGVWNLGNNSPAPFPAILGYHVDRFTVNIEGYTATAGSGSRAIGLADAAGFYVRCPSIVTPSVGVQVVGPAFSGVIDYVAGASTADDLVALTCADYSTTTGRMAGDITDVTIGTINAINTGNKILNLSAGTGWLLDSIKVTGSITGYGTGVGGCLYVGDDTGDPATQGGQCGYIDCGLVDCVSTNSSPVNLACPNVTQLKIAINHNPSSSQVAIGLGGTSTTATIGQLILTGVCAGSSADLLYLNSSSITVNQVVVENFIATSVPSGGWNCVNVDSGTYGEVVLKNCQFAFTGQNQYAVLGGGGTISRVWILGGTFSGGAHMVNTGGTSGAVVVILSGCKITGFGRVCQFNSAATVTLAQPDISAMSFELFQLQGSSTLFVQGSYTNTAGSNLFGRTASQAVRVNSFQLQADLSTLTPSEGDFCYNSNAGLSCGTGVAIHHTGGTGNGWKNLYSGSTY